MQRRNFLKWSATSAAAALFGDLTYAGNTGEKLLQHPDSIEALTGSTWLKLTRTNGTNFSYGNMQVSLQIKGNAQAVYIHAPQTDLRAVRLRWKYKTTGFEHMLGDHWERSYGDLAWKTPERSIKNPWYVLLNDNVHTACFGVKTGANTLCWWNVTPEGIELTMDTHTGGVGVQLANRLLHAADIVTTLSQAGENPYATGTRFCRMMCDKPRLPKQPVYGINDWYVVYGNNSSKTVSVQTAFMAELVSDTTNRPFSVIDDGWEQPDDFSKWNAKFTGMHQSAGDIKKSGMRPGLWTRPLIAKLSDKPAVLAPKIPGRDDGKAPILDPTVPETIERIKYNLKLYRDWGFEMVKHDYSTYDIFGKWGVNMTDGFTAPGWHFYDRSHTNAEIINHLYQAIREAAGPIYVIGCNTLSHLSAGVFELNRTGDDTSGKEWARTKQMGVNTLGFRLPQHQTFYAADGDCVGLTADIPWQKNRQWLQLLAGSGAPLFISAQIDTLTSEQKMAIKAAFAKAAKPQFTGEPLDWLTNPWPERWKLNGSEVTFKWD